MYTSSVLVAMLMSSVSRRPDATVLLFTPTAITRDKFLLAVNCAAAVAGSKPVLDAPSVNTTSTRGTLALSGRIPLATLNTLVSTLWSAVDVCVPAEICVMAASAAVAAD